MTQFLNSAIAKEEEAVALEVSQEIEILQGKLAEADHVIAYQAKRIAALEEELRDILLRGRE